MSTLPCLIPFVSPSNRLATIDVREIDTLTIHPYTRAEWDALPVKPEGDLIEWDDLKTVWLVQADLPRPFLGG